MILSAYYLTNFLLFIDQKTLSLELSKELNMTAVSEIFYWFTYNAQREMINDPGTIILNRDAFEVSITSIDQCYYHD